LILEPHEAGAGLDSWDEVLGLVQEQFELQASSVDEVVYVSHQAGTPAISSAVQFCSLAKFGHQVQFLVSNEFDADLTTVIDSSAYLANLQLQQAKRLVDNFNYAGARELLAPYLRQDSSDRSQKIANLLATAVQWNFSEFDDFKQRVQALAWLCDEGIANRFDRYWWYGYEAAYLAKIRLKQKNTVEALFQSFRAIEGMISMWAVDTYGSYIREGRNALIIKPDITQVLPGYLQPAGQSSGASILDASVLADLHDRLMKNNLKLYSASLYELLRVAKPSWKASPDIAIVWSTAAERRNQQFHKILGMKEFEVFDAWETKNSQQWEQRLLGCLNFVTEQAFSSLEEASVMNHVHQRLKEELEKYRPH
jgi:hypothetical protein